MTFRTVQEPEFYGNIKAALSVATASVACCVTGPGRSGAVAAVYASHILGIPFIPYRQCVPEKLHPVLVIDTATWTGATDRKAKRLYGEDAIVLSVYHEPPMVKFWYEKRAKRESLTKDASEAFRAAVREIDSINVCRAVQIMDRAANYLEIARIHTPSAKGDAIILAMRRFSREFRPKAPSV